MNNLETSKVRKSVVKHFSKMVMSRSTAIGSIVMGSILLVCGIIVVICGAISASKMSDEVAASAGLWSLYVSILTRVLFKLCVLSGHVHFDFISWDVLDVTTIS